MALLWGVAYGWQQDARVRQAQQVGDIAAELHQRFGTLMQHLHKTGRSLNTAITAYNALVSSLDGKILPQMRKLEDLGSWCPVRISRMLRPWNRRPAWSPVRLAWPTVIHRMVTTEPTRAWSNTRGKRCLARH